MSFFEWELTACPAYAYQGGPNGQTHIDTLKNRHERRVALGDLMLHTYVIPFDNISIEEYQEIKGVHAVMYAMTHSFLIKDWLDFTSGKRNVSTDRERIGNAPAGSAAVQLYKTYDIELPDGTVIGSRTRDITKPLSTIVVYQMDGSNHPVLKPGTVDTLTGLFTPDTAWTEGRAISWAGEFRVPVRFNNDYMPMSIEEGGAEGHRVSGQIELVEVPGE